MTIREVCHPFRWLAARYRWRVFVVLLAITSVMMTALARLNSPLVNDTAPLGIVSLQLAGDLLTSTAIIESWGPRARICAAFQTGLDFLYLAVYSLCLAFGCALVADVLVLRHATLARFANRLAWALLAAMPLDAVENLAVIQLMLGSNHDLWPLLARWCAIPKFVIVLIGIAFVISGGIFSMFVAKQRDEITGDMRESRSSRG